MNQWVYDGFAITYKKRLLILINITTSNTYLLGKDVVK
jgi:hypothetical protein